MVPSWWWAPSTLCPRQLGGRVRESAASLETRNQMNIKIFSGDKNQMNVIIFSIFLYSSSSMWTRYILWHSRIIGYFGYVRASSCSRKLKIIDTWKYAEDYKYVERENLQIWLWLHTRRTIRSLRCWYRWFYFRISTLIVSPPPTISHPTDVKSLSKSCQPHDLILKFGRRPDSELICSGLNNIFISNGAPLQTGLN